MSNAELNKADGCDVFFSLLTVVVLLAGFFIFKSIMEPNKPLEVDHNTEKVRSEKIATHNSANETYNAMIDTFHSEKNSTIEKVMLSVINKYQGK